MTAVYPVDSVCPPWVLGDLVDKLSPDERRAMRFIVEYGDVLIVEGRPWLLVPADRQLLDKLVAFEAVVDDIEAEYEGDLHEDREPDHDNEHTQQGFANHGCTPGKEWWLNDCLGARS